jgi:hypothetical protein
MARDGRTGEQAQQELPFMGRTTGRAAFAGIVTVVVLAACAPQPGIVLGGFGAGPSSAFSAADGTYHVHWSAHDDGGTSHGCLVGLAIEQITAPAAEPGPVGRRMAIPKLTYRTIAAGSRLVGDATVVLGAGTYLIRSEGTCGWDAQIVPAGPDETPMNRNPRMNGSWETA